MVISVVIGNSMYVAGNCLRFHAVAGSLPPNHYLEKVLRESPGIVFGGHPMFYLLLESSL
jgi:hypothetical protein